MACRTSIGLKRRVGTQKNRFLQLCGTTTDGVGGMSNEEIKVPKRSSFPLCYYVH
jgi:hypothetical protein